MKSQFQWPPYSSIKIILFLFGCPRGFLVFFSWVWIVKFNSTLLTKPHFCGYLGGYPTVYYVWTIWRECNQCIFKGEAHSLVELKRFSLLSLYDWIAAMSGLSFSLLVEFLDLCNFRWLLYPVYMGSSLFLLLYLIKLFITYKKIWVVISAFF